MHLYGRVPVDLLYLDAMGLESFKVLNQVYKTKVAVKGRCETRCRQSQSAWSAGSDHLVSGCRTLGSYQCRYSNRFGLP